MSTGDPRDGDGAELDAGGLRFAIVVARFNRFITARLLDGAVARLAESGAAAGAVAVQRVPGASAAPVVAAAAAAAPLAAKDWLFRPAPLAERARRAKNSSSRASGSGRRSTW